MSTTVTRSTDISSQGLRRQHKGMLSPCALLRWDSEGVALPERVKPTTHLHLRRLVCTEVLSPTSCLRMGIICGVPDLQSDRGMDFSGYLSPIVLTLPSCRWVHAANIFHFDLRITQCPADRHHRHQALKKQKSRAPFLRNLGILSLSVLTGGPKGIVMPCASPQVPCPTLFHGLPDLSLA